MYESILYTHGIIMIPENIRWRFRWIFNNAGQIYGWPAFDVQIGRSNNFGRWFWCLDFRSALHVCLWVYVDAEHDVSMQHYGQCEWDRVHRVRNSIRMKIIETALFNRHIHHSCACKCVQRVLEENIAANEWEEKREEKEGK